ncbi:MAG: stage II sporulation protein R [Clostridioides sp.]|jgi:stage II sporulation protein R|nr:stage II sporulation protein R [Clostridioides sp.]
MSVKNIIEKIKNLKENKMKNKQNNNIEQIQCKQSSVKFEKKIIKLRIITSLTLLIGFISVIAFTINSEAKKIDEVSQGYKNKLIRFHVLANSDSIEDQNLKLNVRDEVINYLQPRLQESADITESEAIITKEMKNINQICERVIEKNSYNYSVTTNLTYSNFPTKQYANIVLPSGRYKTLKIVIGEGKGKNWWCVMFPPLCFVDDEKTAIDAKTDEKLKSILSEEEYNMIAEKTVKQADEKRLKFKTVEIINKFMNKDENKDSKDEIIKQSSDANQSSDKNKSYVINQSSDINQNDVISQAVVDNQHQEIKSTDNTEDNFMKLIKKR